MFAQALLATTIQSWPSTRLVETLINILLANSVSADDLGEVLTLSQEPENLPPLGDPRLIEGCMHLLSGVHSRPRRVSIPELLEL